MAAPRLPHSIGPISPARRMAARVPTAYAEGMRYEPEVLRQRPGPEELALDSWVEDSGPYVLLSCSGPEVRAECFRASSAGSSRASTRVRRARQSASPSSVAAG